MGKWHGFGKTRLYSIWKSMKTRCYNPHSNNYKWYGAKGITVCDEWKEFLSFYEWSMNNGYADNLTLDRRDNNSDYSPDNCRLISIEEQQHHRSDNVLITIKGETRCLSEWGRILGVNSATARSRHLKGKSWEESFEIGG